MTGEPVFVTGAGATGPLGLARMQIAMSVRAHKMEPRDTTLLDQRGDPIGICRASAISDQLVGSRRLIELAAPALIEAGVSDMEAPMILALPPTGRADDDPQMSEIAPAIAARAGLRLDAARSSVIRAGRAGFAQAITAAARLFASSPAPSHVVVGGADSLLHPGVIADLDQRYELFTRSNTDGVIPSEGAAFLVLSKRSSAGALASIRAAAIALEEAEPNIAEAWSRAVREVSADRGVAWLLSDLSNVRARIREWSMVEARAFDGPILHERAADDLGEIGAAIGPTLAAIACSYWSAGCAPATSALLALASDGPERAAMWMEGPS